MPVDNFDIHWRGTFKAPTDGNYRFKAVANDEMTVAGNGDTILYFNSNWAENTPWYEVHLSKNENYMLDVWYHEKDLEATATLMVSVNGGDFMPVTTDWASEIIWQTTTRCFTTKGNSLYIIEFERPDCTKPLRIFNMPDINPKATLYLKGIAPNALKWKQDSKGTLTIDFSKVGFRDLEALEHAWVIQVENYQP